MKEVAAILAVCGALYFTRSWEGHLNGDPLHYASIAKNIVDTGEWILLQDQPGVIYPNKPPLMMWLVAATFKVVGVNVWAARLWSSLFATATSLIVFLIARRFFDKTTGMIAGCMAASFAGNVVNAVDMRLDSSVTLATVCAAYAAIRAVQDKKPVWLLAIGVAAGLGAMVKPVALLHVYAVSALALACFNPKWLWHRYYLLSVPLAASILAPWHLAVIARGGEEFTDAYVGVEMASRITLGAHIFSGVWKNLTGIAQIALPWWPLFLAAMWKRRGLPEFPSRLAWFIGLWIAEAVVFMAIPPLRYDRYMLVTLPAIAIPAAWITTRGLSAQRRERAPIAIGSTAVAAIACMMLLPIQLHGWRQQAFVQANCYLNAFAPGEAVSLYDPRVETGLSRTNLQWSIRSVAVFYMDRGLYSYQTLDDLTPAASPFVLVHSSNAAELDASGWSRVLTSDGQKYGFYEHPTLRETLGVEAYDRAMNEARQCADALPTHGGH